MAKFKDVSKRHDGGAIKITTKSFYGTSKEDVIQEFEDGRVLAKDDRGEYWTTKDRVGTGLANPHRWDRK